MTGYNHAWDMQIVLQGMKATCVELTSPMRVHDDPPCRGGGILAPAIMRIKYLPLLMFMNWFIKQHGESHVKLTRNKKNSYSYRVPKLASMHYRLLVASIPSYNDDVSEDIYVFDMGRKATIFVNV
jgi:hypothetical protein